MKIERTKNATRNIIFGVILKVYQMLLPFLMRTAMIYFMGMQYLGLNGIFSSILQVLSLAELGVGSALVFSMYKPIAEDDTETICALMRLYKLYYRIIGIVIAIIGIALTPAIPYLIKGDIPGSLNIYVLYYLNLSVTVVSYWLFGYMNCLFQAHQRIDVINKVMIATFTFQYGLQIIVLMYFKNYYYYLVVALVTQILTNMVTAFLARKKYPKYRLRGEISKDERKVINKRVRDLFTAKLGSIVVGSVDTIVISIFLGLIDLAIYQNYFYIMNSVFGFFLIFMNSCTAGIGNSIVAENIEKNYDTLGKLTYLVFVFVSFCTSCLLCIYQPFMKIWVGTKYMLAFGSVVCFCIYFALFTINQFWCTYKDAAGIWHQDRFRPLISAMGNLTLNLLLVKFWGLYAIILSTVISYLTIAMPWLLYNLFTVLFKGYFKAYFKSIFKYVLITIITCVLCYVSTFMLPYNVVGIIIRLVTCTVFNVIIFILLFKNSRDFEGAMDILDHMTAGKMKPILKLIVK